MLYIEASKENDHNLDSKIPFIPYFTLLEFLLFSKSYFSILDGVLIIKSMFSFFGLGSRSEASLLDLKVENYQVAQKLPD